MGLDRLGPVASFREDCLSPAFGTAEDAVLDFEQREEGLVDGRRLRLLGLFDLDLELGDPTRGIVELLLVPGHCSFDVGAGIPASDGLEARCVL